MKRLMIAAAALMAAACTPPATEEAPTPAAPELEGVMLPLADQAGNRMEALTQNGASWCTGDGVWCATQDGAGVQVTRGGANVGSLAVGESGEGNEWSVWPVIVRVGRNDDSALVGVAMTARAMYSGGGGESTQLYLYNVAGGAGNEAVRMPLGASKMIRACFAEADSERRGGACHDEYAFVTRISLDEEVSEGAPHLILQTAAGAFPSGAALNNDSAEEPPLTQADLVWSSDATCSYRRTYTRAADGLYAPDQALPACADYLEP
jgi:hypothetical protein